MHAHLIGVCGTGMGALAGLLKAAGHRVTGSDTGFYPPMGQALLDWGIETLQGYDPSHLDPAPDLVVIGNVCRPDNIEARAALDRGLKTLSFPGALSRFFLEGHPSYVVAGTHGKTTTTALLAHLLRACGRQPGYLIGGVPIGFDGSFAAGARGAPFVIEGDEYDSAFFEKIPKFWQYRPQVACLNAIEHDHIDIYPDMESYRQAFRGFVERIPASGLLVVHGADPEVIAASASASCPVRSFAVDGEEPAGGRASDWLARDVRGAELGVTFELVIGGRSRGPVHSPLSGRHNLRNVLAALAMAHEGAGEPLAELQRALASFRGIKRRQELRGTAGGVRVYDDFAHHPSAVRLTLEGLRQRHPEGKLLALFEPRSATASRRLHQAEYPRAFAAADLTLLAPVGRTNIPDAEKLDVAQVAAAIRTAGADAQACDSIDALVAEALARVVAGDTIVAMSNGAFGNVHERLLEALRKRDPDV